MSRSLNKVHLIGNVGADPEVRATTGGQDVANFSLATSRQWNDAAGNKQEKTEWHRCTVWGALAGVVDKYVRKGDKLYVEGSVEYRTWTDRDGAQRFSTDIVVRELVMLGSAGGHRANAGAAPRERDAQRRPQRSEDDGQEELGYPEEWDAAEGGEAAEEEYDAPADARERSGKRTREQNRPARRPASQRRSSSAKGGRR